MNESTLLRRLNRLLGPVCTITDVVTAIEALLTANARQRAMLDHMHVSDGGPHGDTR